MAQPVPGETGDTYWDTVKFRSAALLESQGNQYDIYLVQEAKVQALEALITQLQTDVQAAFNLATQSLALAQDVTTNFNLHRSDGHGA